MRSRGQGEAGEPDGTGLGPRCGISDVAQAHRLDFTWGSRLAFSPISNLIMRVSRENELVDTSHRNAELESRMKLQVNPSLRKRS